MIYFAIIYYGNDNQASLPVVQVPTDTILYAILWFVILVLLFCIGIRRHNGLWSTEEPWIDGAGPVLAGSQPHMWYGQQQMMYQQGAYPPQNTVMYQPQAPQPAQYGWQPQPGQQPYQPYQPSSSSPSEVPGLSPRLAPAGDPAPMLQSGPEIQPPGQVNHEMKA